MNDRRSLKKKASDTLGRRSRLAKAAPKLTPSMNDLKSTRDEMFHQHLLNRRSVNMGRGEVTTPGAHPISSDALQHHLQHGSYSLITAHNPNSVKQSDEQNAASNTNLEGDLHKLGAMYHKVKGVFGGNQEDSYLVHHTQGVTPQHLNDLSHKYGQECVVHSSGGHNQMLYTHGDNAGLHRKGQGHTKSAELPDNYSHPQGQANDKFSLNFDWDNLHKSSLNQQRNMAGFIVTDDKNHTHKVRLNLDHRYHK